ncbi:unnamed protein product [Toxocara canis]|uniref:Chromosome partition protein Smc n=1 Tax=Toxocara canis TaxID=6265 RepID=A0A183TY92_TOXCA|nr:unnamed protein product [Toxocara canis]
MISEEIGIYFRASSLENAMKEKDAMIERLHKEIDDLKKLSEEMQHMEVKLQEAEHVVAEHVKTDEIRADGLENALKEKDAIIGDLHKQLDELKELPETVRHLEHRLHEAEDQTVQAPKDEEIKADGLERELKEKNDVIDALHKEIDELRTVKVETPEVEGVATQLPDSRQRFWFKRLYSKLTGRRKLQQEQTAKPAELRETIVNLEGKLRDTELALSEAQKADDVNKLRAETDRLVNEINEKNRIIDELNKLKGEAEWSLGEHRQWLSDANNRANGLENTVKEKDEQIGALNKELDELRAVKVETPADALNEQIEQLQSKVQELEGRLRDSEKAIAEAPKPEENKANGLENAVREKDGIIDGLRKENDELRAVKLQIPEEALTAEQVNELRETVKNLEAKLRDAPSADEVAANGLESAVREKDELIEGMRRENEELKALRGEQEEFAVREQIPELQSSLHDLEQKLRDTEKALAEAPKGDEINGLKSEVDRLVNEINEKNRIIDELNKIKDDKEWSIGEYRQWLSDAHNRANDLENALNEKDKVIEGLHKENDELKSAQSEGIKSREGVGPKSEEFE